mgnify:CR=1 FL=1
MCIIQRIEKMEIFNDFEWYDFLVIAIFTKVFQVLILVTLMGGGFISATILLITWEFWKAYERFRAEST